jgi:sulfur-carrier protein
MITVRYFASIRDLIGKDLEQFTFNEAYNTVAAILDYCRAQSEEHATALSDANSLRAALNQTLTSFEARVNDGDEIAFFPPVTGG